MMRYLVLLLAVLTALYIGRLSPNGVRGSSDSESYMSAAECLKHAEPILQCDGKPFTLWPPGYPALLCLADARTIAIVSAGAWAALAFLLIAQRVKSKRLAFLGALFLILAPPIRAVGPCAWSDMPFSAAACGMLLVSDWYKAGPDLRRLCCLAAVVAVCYMLRYIGVACVLTGVVIIATYCQWRTRYLGRFRQALIFLAISCIPIGLWCLRNLSLGDGLFGTRIFNRFPLYLDCLNVLRGFVAWVIPNAWLPESVIVVFGGFAMALLVVTFLLTHKTATDPCFIFVCIYIVILVFSASVTENNRVRYLFPAFAPALAWTLGAIRERSKK